MGLAGAGSLAVFEVLGWVGDVLSEEAAGLAAFFSFFLYGDASGLGAFFSLFSLLSFFSFLGVGGGEEPVLSPESEAFPSEAVPSNSESDQSEGCSCWSGAFCDFGMTVENGM